MRRLSSPRFLVALGLLAALGAGVVVSAQRASANDGDGGHEVPGVADARAAPAGHLRVRLRRRLRWHFIPDETFQRNGLPIKAMTEPQRTLAHELLKTGLSARGYTTYTQIIAAREHPAGDREQQPAWRAIHEAYRFSVFGTPAAQGTWGWRVEVITSRCTSRW